MKKTIITLTALTFLGATSAAFAQAASFTDLDTDQSGDLTLQEVQVAMPDLTQDQFNAADADGNGTLSQDEFTALQSSMGSDSGSSDSSN